MFILLHFKESGFNIFLILVTSQKPQANHKHNVAASFNLRIRYRAST